MDFVLNNMPSGVYKHKKGYKRPIFSEEWIKKLSESHKGIPFTKESKEKLSKALKGKYVGDKSWLWKGYETKYSGIHTWLRNHKGNFKKCNHCGKKGEKVNGKWNIDRANIDGKYLRDENNYIGLCRKCHIKFDKSITN